jgi:hypothetical protein
MLRSIVRFTLPLAAVGAVVLASELPQTAIDAHRSLGAPIRVENLTVWPVLTDAPVDTGDHLTLSEAVENGTAVIREKGDARGGGAEVNQLMIENRGDRPLLVTAGTIVKGGKQDRQLGQDLVVAVRSTVPVEAFCVESGRWTTEREGRRTDGVFEVPKVKAAKRLRSAAQYDKNQGEVWRQVDNVNRKAANAPATATFLATVDEDDKAQVAVRERLEKTVRDHFAALGGDRVVGFAYSVNGEPLGMRTFANRKLLDAHLEPFVKTMSLEAQVTQFRDRQAGREPFDESASSEALLKMVHGIGEAEAAEQATPGLNKNRTRSNDWGGQSSCLVPSSADGGWIALTEDWTAPAELSEPVRQELRMLEALGYSE